ncbi:MAG: hypothetical protein HY070_03115 [Chloroflexi bacterium]|nr:hypothetical protein [Chloroflexota bacterium]
MQKTRSSKRKSKQTKKSETIFVVVLVISGIPDTVEAFRDIKTAWAREAELRKDIRPDYDEVGVFEIEIGKRED